MAQHVVIVGAGFGGLSAAAQLAARGLQVTVLERHAEVGGKARTAELDGRRLDVGPTVMTMKWVLEEVFARAGERLDEQVRLARPETIARHVWPDGSSLDLYSDMERSAEAIGELAGRHEADAFRRFMAYAGAIYQASEEPFILSERPTVGSLVSQGLRAVSRLARIDGVRSMWRAIESFFDDPRLQQLFGRYATYTGSSPFLAPATLNLIAYVEQQGVWLVEEGLWGLAEALRRVAERRGAEVHTGASVAAIQTHGGVATGVEVEGRGIIPADAVLFNGDVSALADGRLGESVRHAVEAPRPRQRSLSAITLAMVAPTDGVQLAYHNVFFSSDYAQEFADIDEGRLPQEPTVYVAAQDRGNPAAQPDEERLFCIINAPAIGQAIDGEVEPCTRAAMRVLQRAGLTVHPSRRRPIVTTPADFEREFQTAGGAIYGRSTHGRLAALRRPSSRSRIKGLYLAGGSVHPGAGVPMTALSGSLAANAILADHALTLLSPIPGMRGGTSTASQTTAAPA